MVKILSTKTYDDLQETLENLRTRIVKLEQAAYVTRWKTPILSDVKFTHMPVNDVIELLLIHLNVKLDVTPPAEYRTPLTLTQKDVKQK